MNHPNPFFKLLPSIFLLSLSPIKMPTIASAVTVSKSVQLIATWLLISPVNPINDFAAIINSEVPTACFMGSLLNSTSAGIIKKPPPAPTSPVSIPTNAPSSSMSK